MSVEALNTGATTEEAVQAPQGHDEAMLQKFEESQQAQEEQTPTEEPQKFLGKFDSVEDLEKAYKELESKLGQTKEQEPEKDPSEFTEDDMNRKLVENQVDVDSMANFYEQNGSLSDEHYDTLEKAGIPRDYVDSYLSGIEAQATQARDEILSEVGGQEAFGEMINWAVANWTPAQLDAYNKAVDSGDMDTVRSAVMSLAYKYQAENGRNPSLVNGGNGGSSSGFQSVAQLTEAMKDPRYTNDPAYRKEVEAKLARSNIL